MMSEFLGVLLLFVSGNMVSSLRVSRPKTAHYLACDLPFFFPLFPFFLSLFLIIYSSLFFPPKSVDHNQASVTTGTETTRCTEMEREVQ